MAPAQPFECVVQLGEERIVACARSRSSPRSRHVPPHFLSTRRVVAWKELCRQLIVGRDDYSNVAARQSRYGCPVSVSFHSIGPDALRPATIAAAALRLAKPTSSVNLSRSGEEPGTSEPSDSSRSRSV